MRVAAMPADDRTEQRERMSINRMAICWQKSARQAKR